MGDAAEQQGAQAFRIVLVTDGGGSHGGGREWPRAPRARLRHREMQAAMRRLCMFAKRGASSLAAGAR